MKVPATQLPPKSYPLRSSEERSGPPEPPKRGREARADVSFALGRSRDDGSGVSKSLRESGEAVSARLTEAASSAMEQGSALASSASGQIQTFTEDLLAFARRRPFAAL